MRKSTHTSKNTSKHRARGLRNAQQKAPSQPLGPIESFVIDGLTHDAKGVARNKGKVTFISGALPTEVVNGQVFKSNRRLDEARLIGIQKASEHRVQPVCVHYNDCGGCSFQHLAIVQQVEAKRLWLKSQMRQADYQGDFSLLTDTDLGYRRRARLSVKLTGDTLTFGFRGASSQNIVSIESCVVLTPRLQQVFAVLRTHLSDNPIRQHVGHIELLEDDLGPSVLIRLTAKISSVHIETWQAWARTQQFSLYWQHHDENRASLDASAMRSYQVDGMRLTYHPQDFIQVNAAMNQKMVAQAMDWLAPNEDDFVLDLFCGVGNFSLPLAKRAKQVLGIELQPSMVKAGEHNAKTNQLSNLSFMAADLTKPVNNKIMAMGITKVLLDPPRAGALDFLPALLKLKPSHILYVSCDGATLGRDAKVLVENGYQIQKAGLMDMFPHTAHVETMLLLVRKAKGVSKNSSPF